MAMTLPPMARRRRRRWQRGRRCGGAGVESQPWPEREPQLADGCAQTVLVCALGAGGQRLGGGRTAGIQRRAQGRWLVADAAAGWHGGRSDFARSGGRFGGGRGCNASRAAVLRLHCAQWPSSGRVRGKGIVMDNTPQREEFAPVASDVVLFFKLASSVDRRYE